MAYVQSSDGVGVDDILRALPTHLVRDLTTREWSVATDGDSIRFGYYDLIEDPDPGDSDRTITRQGRDFVTTWTHNPAKETARLSLEAERAVHLAQYDGLRAGTTSIADMRVIVADIIDGLF